MAAATPGEINPSARVDRCVNGICPFPSNDAFRFLSTEIGTPEGKSNLTAHGIAHLRLTKHPIRDRHEI